MSSFKYDLKNYGLVPLIVLFLLFITVGDSQGELAQADEMQMVCQNWLSLVVFEKGGWAGSLTPDIIEVNELYAGDTLLARYYNISPRGFVVVPVLKEMTPIKAYSDESNLDESQEGGFLLLLKEMLSSRMGLYAQTFGSLEAVQPDNDYALFGHGQKQLWDKFTVSPAEFNPKSMARQSLGIDEAGPLITSSWHQRAPYNNYCPMGDGDRTVVGCVATAIAQILLYWQWPESGLGTHTYYWQGDNSCGGYTPGDSLTADFTDSYDWANMPDSCDLGCSPTEEEALAELNYEVGVSCDMDYGACGSGSYISAAMKSFTNYFKYSSELTLVSRYQYSLEEWYNIAREEIDNGRPVNYFITRHSIICDGYRMLGDQYQYHMNYGWGGSFNTWFVLDSLYCYWEPDSLCPAEQESMIIRIMPQDKPVLSSIGHNLDEVAGDGDGHADPGENVEISYKIVNTGLEAVNTVGILSSSDPYINVTSASAAFDPLINWGDSGTTQTPFVLIVNSACPDPHYALLKINITSDGGYATSDSFYIFIGDTPGFEDNFDGPVKPWMHKALTLTFNDEWHLDTYRYHSGSNSWKAGGWGSEYYSDNLDAALITPPFLLPANAELSFWHWISAEDNDDGSTAWDGSMVMISSGGGLWEQVTPEGGYPYTVVDNPASPYAPGTPVFSGDQGWTEVIVDLSAYSGVVQLMFRFGTDGYVTQEGWYVDDVVVIGTGCCVDFTGNADCSTEEMPDIADITRLIDYLYISHEPLCCLEEADADASGGEPDIADITRLIDFLYISHDLLSDCP